MSQTTTEQALHVALGAEFPAEVLGEITQAEAFGALAYRVHQRTAAYDLTAAEVLGEIDADDRAYASRANDPAAFLAAKVRDLPDLPDRAPQSADQAVAGAAAPAAPAEVLEVIEAVRAFTDTVERVKAEEFAAATRELGPAQFGWTVDRLDDVRQGLGELLEALAGAAEDHGADPDGWHELCADLGWVGDGVRTALDAIDPGADRHGIPGGL